MKFFGATVRNGMLSNVMDRKRRHQCIQLRRLPYSCQFTVCRIVSCFDIYIAVFLVGIMAERQLGAFEYGTDRN
jgi:hypothetical protein